MQTHWEWMLGGRGRRALPAGAPLTGKTAAVETLRDVLLAEPRTGDEAERVGAAYQLGRLSRDNRSKHGRAALAALMNALEGGHGQAPQRVAVSGLAAAGSGAVEALCRTLATSNDDRLLMFAADALNDAVPRDDMDRSLPVSL